MSEPNSKFPKVSSCHGAPLRIASDFEGTNFYVCADLECQAPCDAVSDEGLEGKGYKNMPEKEKAEIVSNAVKGANEDQRKLIENSKIMTLNEARKILEIWEVSKEEDPYNPVNPIWIEQTEKLVEAARTVQRAEDAEIVNKILKGKCTCTAVYGNACDCGKYLEEAKQKILTPEAPLSDNQK